MRSGSCTTEGSRIGDLSHHQAERPPSAPWTPFPLQIRSAFVSRTLVTRATTVDTTWKSESNV